MQIDVISDTVCPWCYIGKRRLERAMKLRPQIQFDVRWRPFQLDPATPKEGIERRAYIERKFGSTDKIKSIHNALLEAGQGEGIAFAFDKIARTPNTINSHRLIRWAHSANVQDEVVELLFRRFFIDGSDIGDLAVLAQIGADAGMDRELVEELLHSDADREKVEHEDSMARKIGVGGVPSFLVGQAILVTGAQDVEQLVGLIDRVSADMVPAQASA